MQRTPFPIRSLVAAAMAAALLCVTAQLSIPLPSGVPLTLQTLGIALVGALLGLRGGVAAVFLYLLLGAVGLPVFAGWSAGVGVFAGPDGGFLYGFLALAALCGLASNYQPESRWKRRLGQSGLAMAGLLGCHLCGAVQFSLVTGVNLWQSLLIASLPFLLKDAVSVAAGLVLGRQLRQILRRALHRAI